MKKTIALVMAIVLMLSVFSGCESSGSAPEKKDALTVIRENWCRLLTDVGQNTDNVYAKQKIQTIQEDAQQYLDLLDLQDLENIWPDLPWDKSADLTTAYNRIYALALAYSVPQCLYYQDEGLQGKIVKALDWMRDNRYGVDELRKAGWRDPGAYNWWDWEIGAAIPLINTLMLMGIHGEQAEEYLILFDSRVYKPRDYGANRLNFIKGIVGSAVLRDSEGELAHQLQSLEELFVECDDGAFDGQGFYSDGTYIFHGNHIMNGIYGSEFFYNAINMLEILDGTEYAVSEDSEKILEKWYVDGFVPTIQYGRFVRMVSGRQNDAGRSGARILACGVKLYGRNQNSEIGYFLKRNLPYADTQALSSYCSGDDLTQVENLAKESLQGNGTFSKVYAFGDKVVHQRENYTFTVAMSSSRIFNYESINQENLNGWYLSDGRVGLYSKDNPYGSDNLTLVNPYYLTGTTVDSQLRAEVSIRQGSEYLSGQDFVGGATLGQYTVAAMALESYHGDGEPTSNDILASGGEEYGGVAPKHQCTLTAKKAWFLFDEEIICLGADIDSKDNSAVRTIVYNDTENLIEADGWYISNTRGTYKVLDGNAVLQEMNGNWVLSVEHGQNPENATYAYGVYPNGKSQNTVEILQNTAAVQAMHHLELDITGYVFWEAGEYGKIKTDAPMIVICQGDSVAVCDPTHKLTKATVWIDGIETAVDFTNACGKTVIL